MAESEYPGSMNPEGSLPPSADSKEPKFSCTTNKLVVGVAAVAPVAWSSDGSWLVHATGDNSLHVCHKPGSSSSFKVHGVLVGHSETVTCLVTQSIQCMLFSFLTASRLRLFIPWSQLFSSPLLPTDFGFGTSPNAGILTITQTLSCCCI
jgi:hypothetical protein